MMFILMLILITLYIINCSLLAKRLKCKAYSKDNNLNSTLSGKIITI